jgi:hypothetical protein
LNFKLPPIIQEKGFHLGDEIPFLLYICKVV